MSLSIRQESRKMIQKILDNLVDKQIISREEEDVYQYGIECLVLKMVHYISYAIIALCVRDIWTLVLFLIVFGYLRKNAGGFHAKTRCACYIFSCMVVGMFLMVCQIEIPRSVIAILMLIADIIVWAYAPVSSGNMELDEEEQLHYRKKSRWILFVWNILYILCLALHADYCAQIIAEACAVEACVLMIAVAQNNIFSKLL